jgi:hypothetical protein
MRTLMLTRTALLCGLCLLVACSGGSTAGSPTSATEGNLRRSPDETSCKSNSECPSGQRCGFTGAEESGRCVVETSGACLIDPAGRCGCDGQPVDLFCGKGSTTRFASAPVCFVGPCPIPCSDRVECPPRLACQSGFCRLPPDGEKKPKLRP